VTIDGTPVSTNATVDSLKIGSYQIARREFFVDPRARHSEAPTDRIVLGSLGMGELWPVDFELDLAHRRFTLYSPDHCREAAFRSDHFASIPVELNEFGNMYFPVDLNGSKLVATISTTNLDAYMSVDVSRQIFGMDERSPEVETQVDAHGRTHMHFKPMTLTAGDLRLPNVVIRLAPPVRGCTLSNTSAFGNVPEFKGRDDHLCFGAYPLVLGRQTIEHLRLYFATREKALYFAASE
jgi:hypothetical protein